MKKSNITIAGWIAVIGCLASLIVALFAKKLGNNAAGAFGVAGFVLSVVAGIIAQSIADKRNGGSALKTKSSELPQNKYAALLADEQTRQRPEIARLMLYTSVQRAFFDPSFVGTEEARNDPYVQELFAEFDRILAEGYAAGSPAYNAQLEALVRSTSHKKLPRGKTRLIARVLIVLGTVVAASPFLMFFIMAATNSPNPLPFQFEPYIPYIMFAGIALTFVGGLIPKKK